MPLRYRSMLEQQARLLGTHGALGTPRKVQGGRQKEGAKGLTTFFQWVEMWSRLLYLSEMVCSKVLALQGAL